MILLVLSEPLTSVKLVVVIQLVKLALEVLAVAKLALVVALVAKPFKN